MGCPSPRSEQIFGNGLLKSEQRISWQQNPGCRQTKLYINGPNPGLAKFALSLRKQDLRLLTGLLTGHVSLNRHLTIMKLRSDPLCPLCKEDSETSFHFLGSCVARMAIRRDIMGAPIMSSEALRQLRFSTLLRFAKASKRFT